MYTGYFGAAKKYPADLQLVSIDRDVDSFPMLSLRQNKPVFQGF